MSDDTTAPGSSGSLYERMGGAPTVRAAVERFYERVLADPVLARYFQGVDLVQLKHHQALVIGNVLGGPARYEGAGLTAAHARLSIDDGDFDRVGRHLLDVLAELDAPPEASQVVAGALGRLRPQIVTRAGDDATRPHRRKRWGLVRAFLRERGDR